MFILKPSNLYKHQNRPGEMYFLLYYFILWTQLLYSFEGQMALFILSYLVSNANTTASFYLFIYLLLCCRQVLHGSWQLRLMERDVEKKILISQKNWYFLGCCQFDYNVLLVLSQNNLITCLHARKKNHITLFILSFSSYLSYILSATVNIKFLSYYIKVILTALTYYCKYEGITMSP